MSSLRHHDKMAFHKNDNNYLDLLAIHDNLMFLFIGLATRAFSQFESRYFSCVSVRTVILLSLLLF